MTSASVLQKIVDQILSDLQAVTVSVNSETVTVAARQGWGVYPSMGAGVDIEVTVGPGFINQDCSGRIDYLHRVNLRFRGTSSDVTMKVLETVRTMWYSAAARAAYSALQVLSFLPTDVDPPIVFAQTGGSAMLCDQMYELKIEYTY